jgi:alpha-amylase/alpha-mannosidase (GH57 family)
MKKIYLAFLWHHHQPMYKNPTTNMYELPWVRLHATKDYYDTAAILDEFPDIKSNFNLVPSLLAQLDEYAQGIAKDKYLDLTIKNADDLTEDDRIFILLNFFMANWETMIYPYPRYLQLLEKRGKQASFESLKRIHSYFKTGELRDLQVWFNLTWMDPYWRENDPLIKSLYEKGQNFTEEEKQSLVKKQLEICGQITEKYRELQDKGRIEVSTTPFYHPILPLLCDTNNALGATPQIVLPKKRFQHREDAKMQVQKAVEYYQHFFGRPPTGMWPAEGSVSEEVIPIFADAGIKWIATDEQILFNTNPGLNSSRRNLYHPYHLSIMNSDINILFRDHALSDAIGFVYAKWNPADAVADFLKRIHSIGDSFGEFESCFIPVILDGENCWEYYSNDGWDFLRLLCKALSSDPVIETVTIQDYLAKHPPVNTLKTIWPGSWINANYGIWIGHAEDNLAWTYLEETRKFLVDYMIRHPELKDAQNVKAAWERIYAAEGSDWNWWYGDDHSSGNDETFDYLFRQYLINVYESLGEKVPDHLYKAIKGMIRKEPTLEPVDFISPKIDGCVTNYFEWLAAGFYQVGHSGGSMHQVETILKSFHYGFDLENLYFRFDLNVRPDIQLPKDLSFKITFLSPANCELSIALSSNNQVGECVFKNGKDVEVLKTAVLDKILEVSFQTSKLPLVNEQSIIEFVIIIQKNNLEIERWPYQSSVSFPKPSEEFLLKTWSV